LSQLRKIWLANDIAAIAVKLKTQSAAIGKHLRMGQNADGCAPHVRKRELKKSD